MSEESIRIINEKRMRGVLFQVIEAKHECAGSVCVV